MIPEDSGSSCLMGRRFQEMPSSSSSSSVGTTATPANGNCSEVLSGSLTMIVGATNGGGGGGGNELRVCVKVYRTSLEHFAIVCPDKLLACNPIGYVNLRNCVVESGSCSSSSSSAGGNRLFHVVRKSCDGSNVLTFRVQSAADVHRWIDAMSSTSATSGKMSPNVRKRSSDDYQLKVSLPILMEEGDEE